MRAHSQLARFLRTAATAAAVLVLTAASAAAQCVRDVCLVAAQAPKTVTLPNGQVMSVPMWGYALDVNGRMIDGVVVENMTGAGGIIHGNFMYLQAKPDGLVIGNNAGKTVLT